MPTAISDPVLDRVLFSTFSFDPTAPRDERGRWIYQGGPHGREYAPGDVRVADDRDVPPELQLASRQWADALPGWERIAVNKYTGHDFEAINAPMRANPETLDGLTGKARDLAEAIDSAIRKFPHADKPVTTWRSMRSSSPVKQAAFVGALRAAHASGGTVRMPGFGSSSLNPGFAARRAMFGTMTGKHPGVVLEVRSRRGAFIRCISQAPEETEVLHPHNDTYRVVGVHEGVRLADRKPSGEHRETTVPLVFILEAVGDAPPPIRPAELSSFSAPDQPRDERGRWARGDGPHGVNYAPGDVRSAGPEDVPPGLELAAKQWAGTLPQQEKDAIYRYSGDGYEWINKPVRECPETLDCLDGYARNWAENLDSAIRSFPESDTPVTTWRSMRSSSAEKQAGFVEMFRTALATGGVVTMPGFNSATLDPSLAARWAADFPGFKPVGLVLEIRSRRGAYIRELSESPEELEVLHPHNDTYRVVEIHENVRFEQKPPAGVSDKPAKKTTVPLVVVLEAVGDGPPPLRRTAGPSTFAGFDPDLHPHGADGKWAKSAAPLTLTPTPGVPPLEQVVTPPPELVERTEAWVGEMTYPQRVALEAYTKFDYEDVNRGLRQCPETADCLDAVAQQRASAIDAAIRAFPPSPEPLVTYRGIQSRRASAEARVQLEKIEKGFQAALATGEPVTMNGFSSSSIDPNLAAIWATAGRTYHGVVLEIKSPRGAYLGWISNSPGELEVLHPHGERYKVTGVRDQLYVPATPGAKSLVRRTYTLEAVPEPPPPFPVKSGAEFAGFDPDLHPKDEHGRWKGKHADAAGPPPLEQVYSAPPSIMPAVDRWLDSLSGGQRDAIRRYTSDHFELINPGLRKCPDTLDCLGADEAKAARQLDAAIRAFPEHDTPAASYRGLTSSRPGGGGRKKIQAIADGLTAAIASGETIKLDGFVSASVDPVTAARWALAGPGFTGVVMEIVSKRGAYIAPTSNVPSELEVLHTHGDRYRVTGVRKQRYKSIEGEIVRDTYTLEAVPEPPAPLGGTAKMSEGETAHPDWNEDKVHRDHGRFAPADGAAAPAPAPAVLKAVYPGDVSRELLQRADEWDERLSKVERNAVREYTSLHYYAMNKMLRRSAASGESLAESDESMAHRAVLCDLAVRRFGIHPEPVTSYRGVATDKPENLASIRAGLDGALASGGTLKVDGFGSATLNPPFAARWASGACDGVGVVMEIKTRRGAYVEGITRSKGEMEFIHLPGEQYRVTGVREQEYFDGKKTHKTRTYTLEALAEPPPPLDPESPSLVPRFSAAFDWDEDKVHRDHGRFAPAPVATPPSDAGPFHKVYGPDEPRAFDESKIPESLRLAARAWSDSLDPDTMKAVHDYTQSGYHLLNPKMREEPDTLASLTPHAARQAQLIDDAIRSFPPHDPPLNSWRGVHTSDPAKLAAIEAGLRDAHATGGTVSLAGFSSASLNPALAAEPEFSQGVLLEIRSPRGAYIPFTSAHWNEQEVLHPHGERFRVVAVHERVQIGHIDFGDAPSRVYVLEALPEPPPPFPRRVTQEELDAHDVEAYRRAEEEGADYGPPDLNKVPFAFDSDKHPKDERGRWASVPAYAAFSPAAAYAANEIRPSGVTAVDAARADPELQRRAARWADADMTPAEGDAVADYTIMGFVSLNRALVDANGDPDKIADPETRAYHDTLASAIAKFGPTDPPVTVWRGTAFRRERTEAFLKSAGAAMSTGGVVTMPCFQSCTFNSDTAGAAVGDTGDAPYKDHKGVERRNLFLEIRARSGAWVGGTMHGAGSENEWLISPTARYRVVGMRELQFADGDGPPKKRRVVQLEEVPQSTAAFRSGHASVLDRVLFATFADPATAAPKPEWDEKKVHRDHGRFAPAPGNSDGPAAAPAAAGGGSAPPPPPPPSAPPLDPAAKYDPRQDFGESSERPTGDLKAADMPQFMRDRVAVFDEWVTPLAFKALKRYTYDDFKPLNRALRAVGGDVSKLPDSPVSVASKGKSMSLREMGTQMMQAVWAHGPSERPLTCWRRMSLRADRMSEFLKTVDVAGETGGEFRMPVFGSATLNPEFAMAISERHPTRHPEVMPGVWADDRDYFGDGVKQHLLLEIRSRSGVWIGGTEIPFYKQENELLQPPTAKYKVLGWKDVTFGEHPRRVLRLEEVPPDPALYAGGPHDPATGDGKPDEPAATAKARPAPHELTEGEFAADPPPNFVYDPGLPHEADAHSNPGKVTVGPKFFAHPPEYREHIVTHEVGHALSDKMLDDGSAFRLMGQGAYTARVKGDDGRERLTTVHDRTPGENAAESYARLVHESDEFHSRFPNAHRATAEAALAHGFPVPESSLSHHPDLLAHARAGTRPVPATPKPEEELLHGVTDDRQSQLLSELVALNDLKYDRAKSLWTLDGRTAATAKSLVEGPAGGGRKTLREARAEWDARKPSLSAEAADAGERLVRQRELDVKYVAPWLAGADFAFDSDKHPKDEHGRWASTKSDGVDAGLDATVKFDPRRDFGDSDGRPADELMPDDMPRALRDRADDLLDRMTRSTALVTREYTGVYFRELNRALRVSGGDIASLPDTPADPGRAAEDARENPDAKHVTVKEVAGHLMSLMRDFGPNDPPLTCWRHLGLSPERMTTFLHAAEAAAATGGEFQMPTFGSSTLNPRNALRGTSKEFNGLTDVSPGVLAGETGTHAKGVHHHILLEVRSRSGAWIGGTGVSKYDSENEILLPPTAKYKVLGWKDVKFGDNPKDARRILRLEELPPDPAIYAGGPHDSAAKPVGFAFNPDLHPHGEHGRWAKVEKNENSPPPPPEPPPVTPDGPHYRTYTSGDVLHAEPGDIPAAVRDAAKAWSGKLSLPERLAVQWYTEDGHKDVNKRLRKDPDPENLKPVVRQKAAEIDSALRKSPPLSRPVTVWRGLDCHTPGKQAKIEAGLRAALETGGTLRMAGFNSASFVPRKAATFTDPADPVILEVRTRHGAFINALSTVPDEAELLLPHNVAYRVLSVHHNVRIKDHVARYRVYRVEVLDELPPPVTPPENFSLDDPGDADPVPSLARWVSFAFDPDQPRGTDGRWGHQGGASASLGPQEKQDRVREVLSRENLAWPPVAEQLGIVYTPEEKAATKGRLAAIQSRLGRPLTTPEIGAEMAFPGRDLHGERLLNFLHRGNPDAAAPVAAGEHPLERAAAAMGVWTAATQTDEEFKAADDNVHWNAHRYIERDGDAIRAVLPGVGAMDLVALSGWQPGDAAPRVIVGSDGKTIHFKIETRVANSLKKMSDVSIEKTDRGLVLHLNEFNIAPKYQGKGEGTRSLAGMLSAAARLGVWEARTGAVGCGPLSRQAEPGKKYRNGYYTWPIMGFDRRFTDSDRPYLDALPEPARSAKSLSELLTSPGGPAVWKSHGWTVSCTMVLNRDDTPGMRVFQSYLASKSKSPPERPQS